MLPATPGYTILKDSTGAPTVLGEDVWGTTYKAFHHVMQCHVALTPVLRSAFANPAAEAEFVREVGLAAGLRHRHLATVFPLATAGDVCLYAQELPPGEALRAHVAARGPMGSVDALRIVDRVAAALEVAQAAGLWHRGLDDRAVILEADPEEENEEPEVKLVGLALPARISPGADGASTAAAFAAPEQLAGKPLDTRAAIYSLGVLLQYLIVGAVEDISNASAGDTTNIPLSVAKLLNATLEREPAARLASFADLRKAIAAAMPGAKIIPTAPAVPDVAPPEPATEPPAPPPVDAAPEVVAPAPAEAAGTLLIPDAWLGSSEVGTVLRLVPEHSDAVELVISARACFRLGRSKMTACDFVTRFLPRNINNDRKTQRLSKTQAVAKCEDGRVALYDGDGAKKSANGTKYDDAPLTPVAPTFVEKSGTLLLGSEYELRVIPVLHEAADAWRARNIDRWQGPLEAEPRPPLRGAVVFEADPAVGLRTGAWLFTSLAWGHSATQAIALDPAAFERTVGAFHHSRRCFWLEGRLAGMLAVDGVPVAPGEIIPLLSGQRVETGGVAFRVEVADAPEPE